jgi:tetratricopeptide (TPR) repeat protein
VQRSAHRAASDVRGYIVVSEVQRNVAETHAIVSDIRREMVKSQEGVDDQRRLVSDTPSISTIEQMLTTAQTQARLAKSTAKPIQHLMFLSSTLGESPPPTPRICFGRGKLIDEIVGLAENLTPIALIGTGGIGKTSIALTVLHHDRIRQRFDDNRRFIRCDQFTRSCAHFLNRLSEVVGAGVENPKDLASLRPFLSSKKAIIVLDNAESILDPHGIDAQEIYAVVEELTQFNNICLCITSRISTTPADCETFDIPTLSIEGARDAFYRIYKNGERSGVVDDILDQLDFHPLSITLLATVAHHNKWDVDRLTREWGTRRTGVLHTEHNNSLAATVELSLTSPLFQELGPDARALLGVVAFFPQGVNEDDLDWLFPTIPNRTNVLDKFCMLSLTYRSDGFVTMLAPLRDHLSPQDPKSSSLLCTTRDRYFTRMFADAKDRLRFKETRWIASEDVNVEHLLNIFTTIDPDSDSVWDACVDFIEHLAWHKPRLVILGPKIEGLPDGHRSKPGCLFTLSRLVCITGSFAECKRLASHALELYREQGNDLGVAKSLRGLSDTNRLMGLPNEGIRQAGEALDILERFGNTMGQVDCLIGLAALLRSAKQFDLAEAVALHAIKLLPRQGEEYIFCQSHLVLGDIYESKGKIKKAICHYVLALWIASPFNWHHRLFSIHYSLAGLFLRELRFGKANAQIERAKSHVTDGTRNLALATELQAAIWYFQGRREEARSESLCAAEAYEKLGATKNMENCRSLFRQIEKELNGLVASGRPASNCELLQFVLFTPRIDFAFQAQGTE